MLRAISAEWWTASAGVETKSAGRSSLGVEMGLKDDIRSAAHHMRGSDDKKESRAGTGSRFVDFLRSQNIQISKIEHVKARHISDFIAAEKARGLTVRTLQNVAGDLRQILRQAERGKLAGLPELSNKGLGISGASRNGTKTAMSSERLAEKIERLKTPGVIACVKLQDGLGLRAKEARSADIRTLRTWLQRLEKGFGHLDVTKGTKGKRAREVVPVDKNRAIVAVRAAIAVCEAQKSHFLISFPGESSKKAGEKAESVYRNELSRCGFTKQEASHALRYAFARRQFEHYRQEGMSESQALAKTSLDLGHGEGRGRYIKQVYLR